LSRVQKLPNRATYEAFEKREERCPGRDRPLHSAEYEPAGCREPWERIAGKGGQKSLDLRRVQLSPVLLRSWSRAYQSMLSLAGSVKACLLSLQARTFVASMRFTVPAKLLETSKR